jgi:O-antigen/teichoic acid export membrane protein
MPFAGALVFGLIYSRMDIVFLSLLKSPSDVGMYGIAQKVGDVTMALPYFFAGLVMPALTAAAVSNREKFADILSKSYMAMCVGGVGTALLIVLFADVFIVLLAGPDYAAGASALQIMGVKIGLFFVANLLIFTTTALSMQRKMLKGHAIAATISIVAYVILIPWLSYDGAALATTIAEIVILLFAFFLIIEHAGRILSFSIPVKCVLAAVVSYSLITQTAVSEAHWAVQFILVGPLYLILIVIFRTGAWSALRQLARR